MDLRAARLRDAIPWQPLVLRSVLRPEEVAARIASGIEPGDGGVRDFVGRIDGLAFTMRKRNVTWRMHAPVLHGRIEADSTGSVIHAHFGTDVWSRVLVAGFAAAVPVNWLFRFGWSTNEIVFYAAFLAIALVSDELLKRPVRGFLADAIDPDAELPGRLDAERAYEYERMESGGRFMND